MKDVNQVSVAYALRIVTMLPPSVSEHCFLDPIRDKELASQGGLRHASSSHLDPAADFEFVSVTQWSMPV